MLREPLTKVVGPIVVGIGAVLSLAVASAQTQTKSSTGGAAVVCRVLEAKTVERMNVVAVLFHQAEKRDARRLGELLRRHDGASIEFETADGRSHEATVLRLGSCFGRGLLVFPSGSARLAKQEQFWLRFPEVEHAAANP